MKKSFIEAISIGLTCCLSLLFMFACASQKQAGPQNLCRNSDKVLIYYNNKTFDSKLSESLACSTNEILLTMPTRESIHAIPERIETWLSVIDYSGGQYNVKKDPEFPAPQGAKSLSLTFIIGIVDNLVQHAITYYQQREDKKIYQSANQYNADIYIKDGSGEITKIIFYHR